MKTYFRTHKKEIMTNLLLDKLAENFERGVEVREHLKMHPNDDKAKSVLNHLIYKKDKMESQLNRINK